MALCRPCVRTAPASSGACSGVAFQVEAGKPVALVFQNNDVMPHNLVITRPGTMVKVGKAAERQCDHVVLTADNPRSEDPTHIIDDILRGMDHPEQVIVIEDRSAAIGWTIGRAAADDVVLIAGKGHETYQEAGGQRVSISDYGIASRALDARGGAR